MYETKTPLQSLTVRAAGASLLSTLLGLAGAHVDPAVITDGVSTGLQLFSAISAGVAIWGRIRAKAKIEKAA